MSRTRRRGIVFDLDGTLLDSLPLVLAAIRHAIEPFGGTTTMDNRPSRALKVLRPL